MGEHTIETETVDGKDRWTGAKEIKVAGQQMVQVELQPIRARREREAAEAAAARAADEEAARDEALRRKQAPVPPPISVVPAATAPDKAPAATDAPKLINSLGMEFVKIPAGEFQMGSENGAVDEKPAHRVQITRGFEMGKYEVTEGQREAVMGRNPSLFKSCGKDCPVLSVTWQDTQLFIGRLNARNDGYVYRLPTEAEWEYACRAGTNGDATGNLDSMGWYVSNSGGRTHPVGQKQSNAWGLYDMLGNVSEWCSDWYDARYYSTGPSSDPQGPGSGSGRVHRGGSWDAGARVSRPANRARLPPGGRNGGLGFRLVRTAW